MRQFAEQPPARAAGSLPPARGFGPPVSAPLPPVPRTADAGAPADPRAGAPNPVIQRTLKVGGQDFTQAEIDNLYRPGARRTILGNWRASALEHSFATVDKLKEAAMRARDTVPDAAGLFTKANLIFTTETGTRAPTLYFRSGNQSGRLRQQHGSGPLVRTETDKVDYFFSTKAAAEQCRDAARAARTNNDDFVPANPDWRTVPQNGDYHLEVTMSGNDVRGTHLSEGRINLNGLDAYDDASIARIRNQIVGGEP